MRFLTWSLKMVSFRCVIIHRLNLNYFIFGPNVCLSFIVSSDTILHYKINWQIKIVGHNRLEYLSKINFQIIIVQPLFGYANELARKLWGFWEKKNKKLDLQQFWKWLWAYSQQFYPKKESRRNPSMEAKKGWAWSQEFKSMNFHHTNFFYFYHFSIFSHKRWLPKVERGRVCVVNLTNSTTKH